MNSRWLLKFKRLLRPRRRESEGGQMTTMGGALALSVVIAAAALHLHSGATVLAHDHASGSSSLRDASTYGEGEAAARWTLASGISRAGVVRYLDEVGRAFEYYDGPLPYARQDGRRALPVAMRVSPMRSAGNR